MKPRHGVVFAPVLVTAGLIAVLSLGLMTTSRVIAVWMLSLAAIFLVGFVRQVRTADAEVFGRRFDAALRPHGVRTAVPSDLLRMDRELVLGVANAEHSHRRLLPLLRTAAAARLASHHGIDMVRAPDAARARLGDEAWDLLRPDRPEPVNRHGRGLRSDLVMKLIERVESL